jgi:hypothetical protein
MLIVIARNRPFSFLEESRGSDGIVARAIEFEQAVSLEYSSAQIEPTTPRSQTSESQFLLTKKTGIAISQAGPL